MGSRLILRACDYLFVLRPLILTPAWSFFLLGAREGYRSEAARTGTSAGHPLFPDPVVFLALTAILGTAYLLNQIFDKETDRINKKVFYLAEGFFRARSLVLMALAYFLVASFLFHHTGSIHKMPLIFALLLSLLYSLPPFRLCSRPFLDLAANAAGFGGIAFVLGYTVYDPAIGRAAALSIPYVLLVGGIFVITTAMDMEGDRTTGKTTTSVRIGGPASEKLGCVLTACAVLASLVVRHHFATVLCAIPLLICVGAYPGGSTWKRSFFVQSSVLVVILAAIAAWPLYACIILPLVVLARFYYARRFGIIYPGVPPRASSGE
jgi:4-hydroxybenzoate polyprenyltransferase